MNQNIIEMDNVCLRRSGKEILRNVSWRMERGQHWAVIGANGSGKTTLLQIAGAVLFPTSGTVNVLGCRYGQTDMFALRRRIGWVSSALMARIPTGETAGSVVLSGLRATYGVLHEFSDADRELARQRMEQAGIAGIADSPFGVLSQGEQQKTLFARAMMADPELYILDETCSGLDLAARESFLRLVDRVIAAGRAGVIMVTHHIEEIPTGVGNALVLSKGAVLAAGAASEVITGPTLSQAFGVKVFVESRHGRFITGMEL